MSGKVGSDVCCCWRNVLRSSSIDEPRIDCHDSELQRVQYRSPCHCTMAHTPPNISFKQRGQVSIITAVQSSDKRCAMLCPAITTIREM